MVIDREGSVRRLVIFSNTSWSLCNYRRGLIGALRGAGYHVTALAPSDEFTDTLRTLVDDYVEFPMSRKGVNPLEELQTLRRLNRVLQTLKPSALLAFTPKPNIYSGIIAGRLNLPTIHNVAGLGSAFTRRPLLRFLSELGYRWSFSKAGWIYFQNEEDRQLMVSRGICSPEQSSRLPGSGIDVSRFQFVPPGDASPFVFLMCSRLLREKGVVDYMEAAKRLKASSENVRCLLLGAPDPGNPSSLTEEEARSRSHACGVEYLGFTSDVRGVIASSHCLVHPSVYQEGLPRAILEAAAIGRPAITSDWPGCRDGVRDGWTGRLVQPGSVEQLTAAMTSFLRLTREEYLSYCENARRLAESEFDESLIHELYKRRLVELLATP